VQLFPYDVRVTASPSKEKVAISHLPTIKKYNTAEMEAEKYAVQIVKILSNTFHPHRFSVVAV
jgi:hypothetical protein